MTIAAHGITIQLPAGWSGRVFRRSGGVATLHAANFALPLNDGEFGDRSTGAMPDGGSFLALTEYRPDPHLTPGTGLFAAKRLPLPLDPSSFARERLAHARPGQLGAQHFFTVRARPFCLYVVIAGGRPTRRRQLAELTHVLGSVRIEPHHPR
ncbi:MAG: hypothetical protein ACXVRH_12895 [Thermoleophilaceae bacterium]